MTTTGASVLEHVATSMTTGGASVLEHVATHGADRRSREPRHTGPTGAAGPAVLIHSRTYPQPQLSTACGQPRGRGPTRHIPAMSTSSRAARRLPAPHPLRLRNLEAAPTRSAPAPYPYFCDTRHNRFTSTRQPDRNDTHELPTNANHPPTTRSDAVGCGTCSRLRSHGPQQRPAAHAERRPVLRP